MWLLRFLLALTGKGNLNSITDEEAVRLYLESNKSMYFSLLYKRYSSKIYAKSLSLLNDEYLAQDCTHDIIMKILLNLNKFGNKSKFSTWVYSITYNFCIDRIRKKKKDKSRSTDDFSDVMINDNDGIPDKLLLEVKLERLKVILEKLPVSDKSVLLMKYMDSLSIKEISSITNKSESSIKMKIKRAKQKFIKIHESLYGEFT